MVYEGKNDEREGQDGKNSYPSFLYEPLEHDALDPHGLELLMGLVLRDLSTFLDVQKDVAELVTKRRVLQRFAALADDDAVALLDSIDVTSPRTNDPEVPAGQELTDYVARLCAPELDQSSSLIFHIGPGVDDGVVCKEARDPMDRGVPVLLVEPESGPVEHDYDSQTGRDRET